MDSIPSIDWTTERINRLIQDRIEESARLEYKAAASIAQENKKKDDLLFGDWE
jgi:hypothetical protein